MLIPGPGGVMYTTAPADGSAQGGMQQGAPQMSYSSVGSGMQASSGVPGGQGYQVAPAGSVQMASGSVAAQPQAADPMAYAKLAGYGQQGELSDDGTPSTLITSQNIPYLTLSATCRGVEGSSKRTVFCRSSWWGTNVCPHC